jgi:hypothetical protein
LALRDRSYSYIMVGYVAKNFRLLFRISRDGIFVWFSSGPG